jgi:hypothetical protein
MVTNLYYSGYMYKNQGDKQHMYYVCKTLFASLKIASAALGVYVFTGVDTVEAFLGCGKISVWNRLLKQSNNTLQNVMQQLGSDSNISSGTINELEQFVIKVVYNDPVSKTLAEARAHRWRKSAKGNSAKLPPDFDSFYQHCLRAHLQVCNLLLVQ